MLKIGVLMGGKSQEHEVSFNSGRTVCDHLDALRYTIIPLYQTQDNRLFILPWSFLYRGKTTDFAHRLIQETDQIYWSDLKQIVDFIYIAMHGRFAEDGTMQGVLEILGVPYFGSKVFASALSMDKIIQKKILQSHAIAVANGISLNPYQIKTLPIDHIIKKLAAHRISYPLMVKPVQEGSSLGTTVVMQEHELLSAIQKACFVHPGIAQSVLIEEKIVGMEFTCIVITDYKTGMLRALPPTEICYDKQIGFFDYEQKYMPGRSLQYTPARCSPEQIELIQKSAIATMHALDMENMARIDGFLTPDNRVIIIDPNSFSGAAPSSFLFKQAAHVGMNHIVLINHLIETELHHYGILQTMINQENKRMESEQRMKIAVLFGGSCAEKEISLESGRNVVYKLSPHKYEALPIFVDDKFDLYRITDSILVSGSTNEIQQQLKPDMQMRWDDLPTIADFVFIALHGGQGENGCVQGMLEMLGLPYNGSSVLTSALCMDKFKTTEFLHSQGFSTPRNMLVARDEWQLNKVLVIEKIVTQLDFPLITKPHDDGCSVLVSKITEKKQLEHALEELFKTRTHALVEEFIIGMELTVGVLGNDTVQALPPSQAVVAGSILSIEEKFLPGAGENQTPAPLPEKALALVGKTVEEVFIALNCKGYARIDCFYQKNQQNPSGHERVVILEVNTLPGLTPATCIFHQAAEIGLKPMDFIDRIIQLGFEAHKQIKKEKKEIAEIQNLPHTKGPLTQETL